MTERHTLFDPIHIGRMHRAGAAEVAPPFRILSLHQVPLAGTGAQHLAACRDLETLGGGFFGRVGDLIINVIRRDLGIKNTGIFIIGRDGVLTRIDKLIFVGPMYYYLYTYLQQIN